MKRLVITALLAGQMLIAAQPAGAAELTENRTQQMGAFAGLRVRVPLDGPTAHRQARAGLALAPMLHSRSTSGESRMRIGEGLELGMTGDDPVRLSLAGTPLSQLGQGPRGRDGNKLGVSTAGWVAIGVGAAVAVLGVSYLVLMEAIDCDADEECN